MASKLLEERQGSYWFMERADLLDSYGRSCPRNIETYAIEYIRDWIRVLFCFLPLSRCDIYFHLSFPWEHKIKLVQFWCTQTNENREGTGGR